MHKSPFSRRGPDRLMEEVAKVLSQGAVFEFKALFMVVYANLKARNAASGGEEMLRLRSYEKLQSLVSQGAVRRVGKEYSGVVSTLRTLLANFQDAADAHVGRRALREVGAV